MREILFRGKRIDGHRDNTKDGTMLHGHLFVDKKGQTKIKWYNEHHGTAMTSNVDPNTVGQYTGMKDENGRKIFEGDIVVLNEDVKKTFEVDDGEIRYGWGGFYVKKFSSLNSLNTLASFNCILRGKVIGNIHDNPELLNV